MSKHLIIDFGYMTHRLLYSQIEMIKLYGFDILRHVILKNGIFYFLNKFSPDNVWIACDTGKSWRKQETAIYKANRVDIRDKQTHIKWDEYYNFISNLQIELETVFPFKVMSVSQLEADDIVGHLIRTLPSEDEKIIITDDKDYIQLLKYNNTSIWSSKKNSFLECISPTTELLKKIIIGDKSDNIPPIRKGIGEKTAIKLIDNGEIYKMLEEVNENGEYSELKRNFERNKKLIDLEFTPKSLIDKLQKIIDNYQLPNGKDMFTYFVKNKLRDMIAEIDKYRNYIKPLINNIEPSNEGIMSLFSK